MCIVTIHTLLGIKKSYLRLIRWTTHEDMAQNKEMKHYIDDMRDTLKCYNSMDKKTRYQQLTQKTFIRR